ncbi:proteasome subunit alpha type [Haematococcus lacustris]|uniref:Proteasome subunit alpha type n=1 Tax=Haematococcus lacustris TaxID=44745 RepID=A0A699YXB9_HAELA|nr:proteasome subunit alpha type [Haematococcus lacustris]
MFLTRSEYDRGVNTFSPEGRIFQVEYAIEAIKLGSTAIGVTTPHGVVLAVEKRITSPLLEPKSIEKIMEIDCHMGCAMSGLTADAKMLIDHARAETQVSPVWTLQWRVLLMWVPQLFVWASDPLGALCSNTGSHTTSQCQLSHAPSRCATLPYALERIPKRACRPFGVALLIAGWDDLGPVLFHTDPSGTYTRFSAKAIGSGAEGAQSSLVEGWRKDLSLEEAETLALATLKQVMCTASRAGLKELSASMPQDYPVTSTNVDIARVTPEYHLYTTAEIEAVMARRQYRPVSWGAWLHDCNMMHVKLRSTDERWGLVVRRRRLLRITLSITEM